MICEDKINLCPSFTAPEPYVSTNVFLLFQLQEDEVLYLIAKIGTIFRDTHISRNEVSEACIFKIGFRKFHIFAPGIPEKGAAQMDYKGVLQKKKILGGSLSGNLYVGGKFRGLNQLPCLRRKK